MNITPSLNEINKNSTMNPNMLTKYYKLKLMNEFMNIKYQNPKMTQSEISSQLNMSSSTIQRYRNDINMFSPYRISPLTLNIEITLKNDQKRPKSMIMVTLKDLKRLQMTSRHLQMIKKNKIKKQFKRRICTKEY